MKKKLLTCFAVIMVVLVAALLFWRFWPRAFHDAMSVDESAVNSFSVQAIINRVENGELATDLYQLDSNVQPQATADALLEILSASDYRPDFRNLLPWKLDYVDADRSYDGRTVTVVLNTGNEKDDFVQIQLLGSSIAAVSSGDHDGFRIYHPTKPELLDELIGYLQTNGETQ